MGGKETVFKIKIPLCEKHKITLKTTFEVAY
jgi:hypothetical protein